MDLFDLTGRVALVTGGSRGIGFMIAQGYVAAGAKVYIASRDGAACEAAATEIGGDVVPVAADLSTVAGVQALAAFFAEREERLDILVNNAGATWGEPIESFSEKGWDKVMDINVKGLFFLTQALHPLLRVAGTADLPARVINIASVDGIHVAQYESYSYAASKAAVIHLTKSLAKRLVVDHVNVNAIAPGLFPSKMTQFMFENPDESMMSHIPQQRAGNADDMAGAAIFLAARSSSYITGQILAVDGGLTGLL